MKTTFLYKILAAVLFQTIFTSAHAQSKPFEGKIEYKVSAIPKTELLTEQHLKKFNLQGDKETQYYKNGNIRRVTPLVEIFYLKNETKLYYKFPGVDTLYSRIPAASSQTEVDFPEMRENIAGRECSPIRYTSGFDEKKVYYPSNLSLGARLYKNNATDLENYMDSLFFPYLKFTNETPVSLFEQVCTSLEEKQIDDSIFILPALPIKEFASQTVLTYPSFKTGSFMQFINRQIDGSVAAKHLKIKKGQKEVRQEVHVSFIISANGKLLNPFVVNAGEVHKKLAEEALRVIANSPAWLPAKYKGQSFPAQVVQPIVYIVSSE